MAELTTSSAPGSGSISSSPTPLTSSYEEAMRQCTDALDQCWVDTRNYVERKPITSLGIAFGVAFVLGLLLRGGGSSESGCKCCSNSRCRCKCCEAD